MKIKTGFVTNSSSTCFILNHSCNLKPVELIMESNRISIEEILKNIDKKFTVGEKSEIYIFDTSGYLDSIIIDSENEYDKENSLGKLKFDMELSWYVNNENQNILCLTSNLSLKSLSLSSDPDFYYIDKIIEILNDSFKGINEDLEFSFLQYPVELFGDGWDQGDSMGQYDTQYSLAIDQNKIGKIVREDNTWKLILKNYLAGEKNG